MQLKNNKIPGDDGITPELLKLGEETIVEEITRIADSIWHLERIPIKEQICSHNQWSCPHNLVGSRDICLDGKPNVVGVVGPDNFVPSCCQKRENTAFDLVLRSTWKLSSPGKQVARSSTPS